MEEFIFEGSGEREREKEGKRKGGKEGGKIGWSSQTLGKKTVFSSQVKWSLKNQIRRMKVYYGYVLRHSPMQES